MTELSGNHYQTKKYSITEPTLSTVSDSVRKVGKWQVTTIAPAKGEISNVLKPKQIHGGNIVQVDELQRGEVTADGVIVASPNISVGISTADCAPVVLASDKLAIVLHVSRKSLVNGLLDNVITYMEPTEIDHVFIGPHVCEYHFGFDEEDFMVRRFRYRFPKAAHFHKGVMYLSLRKALQQYFDEWYVHPDRIEMDGRCTYEMLDLPSYKRWLEGGKEGEVGRIMTIVKSNDQ